MFLNCFLKFRQSERHVSYKKGRVVTEEALLSNGNKLIIVTLNSMFSIVRKLSNAVSYQKHF